MYRHVQNLQQVFLLSFGANLACACIGAIRPFGGSEEDPAPGGGSGGGGGEVEDSDEFNLNVNVNDGSGRASGAGAGRQSVVVNV